MNKEKLLKIIDSLRNASLKCRVKSREIFANKAASEYYRGKANGLEDAADLLNTNLSAPPAKKTMTTFDSNEQLNSPAAVRSGDWSCARKESLFISWSESLQLRMGEFRLLYAVKFFERFYDDYPSLEEYSQHTGINIQTVRHHLHFLRDNGYIIADERSGYSTVYRVNHI